MSEKMSSCSCKVFWPSSKTAFPDRNKQVILPQEDRRKTMSRLKHTSKGLLLNLAGLFKMQQQMDAPHLWVDASLMFYLRVIHHFYL